MFLYLPDTPVIKGKHDFGESFPRKVRLAEASLTAAEFLLKIESRSMRYNTVIVGLQELIL